MKQLLWIGILALGSVVPAIADISQQEFDRDMILMQEQVNQIQNQVDSIRKLMELEQQINSPPVQNNMLEGEMMGGAMPKGADPAKLPDPQSKGAQLINHYCTQCHGLPTPILHSDIGWPPVINRMSIRMEWLYRNNSKMGIFAPTPEDVKTITEYMQKYAGEFSGGK